MNFSFKKYQSLIVFFLMNLSYSHLTNAQTEETPQSSTFEQLSTQQIEINQPINFLVDAESITPFSINTVKANNDSSLVSLVFKSTTISDEFGNFYTGALFFKCQSDTPIETSKLQAETPFIDQLSMENLFNSTLCERLGKRPFYDVNTLSSFIAELQNNNDGEKWLSGISAFVGLLGGAAIGAMGGFAGVGLGGLAGVVAGYNIGYSTSNRIHNRRVMPLTQALQQADVSLQKNNISTLNNDQLRRVTNRLNDFLKVYELSELRELKEVYKGRCITEIPKSNYTRWQRFNDKHEDDRDSCVDELIAEFTSTWRD